MKKLPFLLTFLLSGANMIAQTTDFNTIVQPVDMKAKDFGEYLVQLAWVNNPESAIAQDEVQQAKAELKAVKKDWMKDFQLTFNLNEANLARNPELPKILYNSIGSAIYDSNKQLIPLQSTVFDEKGNPIPLRTAGGSAFYPKYNFGLNVNLGNLLAQKNKNQVKQYEVRIAEHNVNKAKFALRNEVLSAYQNYKLAKEILKTRVQIEQNAKDIFVVVSELYKKDEETFEHYNEATSSYHEAMEARIQADSEVQIAKLKIEEIIGLRWEQVQHPQKEN